MPGKRSWLTFELAPLLAVLLLLLLCRDAPAAGGMLPDNLHAGERQDKGWA